MLLTPDENSSCLPRACGSESRRALSRKRPSCAGLLLAGSQAANSRFSGCRLASLPPATSVGHASAVAHVCSLTTFVSVTARFCAFGAALPQHLQYQMPSCSACTVMLLSLHLGRVELVKSRGAVRVALMMNTS